MGGGVQGPALAIYTVASTNQRKTTFGLKFTQTLRIEILNTTSVSVKKLFFPLY